MRSRSEQDESRLYSVPQIKKRSWVPDDKLKKCSWGTERFQRTFSAVYSVPNKTM